MTRHLSEHDLEDLFKQHLPAVELPPDVAAQVHTRVMEEVHATMHAPSYALNAPSVLDEEPTVAYQNGRGNVRTRRAEQRGMSHKLAEWFAGLRLAPSLAFAAATAAVLIVALIMMPRLLDGLREPLQPAPGVQPEQLPVVEAEQPLAAQVTISGGDAQIQRGSDQIESFGGATVTGLYAGETLITGSGTATVAFSPDQSATVAADSTLTVASLGDTDAGLSIVLEQSGGTVTYVLTTAPAQFELRTTLGVVNAETSEFTVSVSTDDELSLSVAEASVTLSPTTGDPQVVSAGQEALLQRGQAPLIQSRMDGANAQPMGNQLAPTPTATAVALVLVPTATPTSTSVPNVAAAQAPDEIPTATPTVLRTSTTDGPSDGAGGAAPNSAPSTPTATAEQRTITVTATPTPADDSDNGSGSVTAATPPAQATTAPTATSAPSRQPNSTPPARQQQAETATNTPGPAVTATPRSVATNTPQPTATATPRSVTPPRTVATNTPLPTATNTPLPTPTNTPRPTATLTPTPVNHAPTVQNETGLVLNEDTSLTVPVLSNDSDVDGDALFVTAVRNGQFGQAINNQNNTVTYIPAPNFNGTDSFSYQVSDGVATVTGTVSVTVRPVNDPPRFTLSSTELAGSEDAGSQVISNWLQEVSPGAENEASQTVRAEIDVENPALFVTLPTVDVATGTLTFQSAPDVSGTTNARITLRDSEGATSEAQSFSVTITPVNDPPTFDLAVAQITVDEDSGPQRIGGWLVNAQPGPPNEWDQSLRAELTLDNPALFAATPEVSIESGDLRFTPAENAFGSATGAIQLFDSGGASSAVQTFTITVTPQNDAPEARADTFTVAANRDLTGNLLADNGAGADRDPEDDELTIVAVNGGAVEVEAATTLASGARLTVNRDGSLRYEPTGAFAHLAAGERAQEEFTYTVSDGNGGTDQASVRIEVEGVNQAPLAQSDEFVTDATSILRGDLLADNGSGPDRDPEGAGLFVTRVNGMEVNDATELTLPSGAQLTIMPQGTFIYDPGGLFQSGDRDEFTYAVTDAAGASSSAAVSVLINPLTN